MRQSAPTAAAGSIVLLVMLIIEANAAADGISLQAAPLHNILSSPAYAVVVDDVKPVEGKPAIKAVVRQVLGSGNRPVASSTLKVGQRVELPTYQGPKPVAHKWVIARRYWNVCREQPLKKRLLLVSTWNYFEALCDTKANRSKLKIFLKENAGDLYAKQPVATLRRGLGDPDTYHWARSALIARRRLRDRDIIAAAHRMPDRCGATPLFDRGNQLKGSAKLAFARKTIAQLRFARRSRFANFVSYQLEDAAQRSLFVAAMRQLRRVRLDDAAALRRVCTVVSPISYELVKQASPNERVAARALLAWMERFKAFDEHCKSAKARLNKAVAAP